MSERELGRAGVLARVKGGDLRVVDAAELMRLSYRQAKRLWRLRRVARDGDDVHVVRHQTITQHRYTVSTHRPSQKVQVNHAPGVIGQDKLPAIIRRDIERRIQTQKRAIDRLTRAAQEFIADDPELARRYELLLSIPGFGATSAVHILAELNLLPAGMDVRQWVAYAGLDPREYSSGTSVHKKVRISKAGNKHLRRALYMPALVAVQHQAQVRAYNEHIQARGKTKMQALVATMHKLLHAIFGMFKHDQLFDGAKVYAAADAELARLAARQEVLCP